MNKNFIKSLSINIIIFSYISIVLVNFFHNTHTYFIKSEELSQINNKEIYLLKKENLKKIISDNLTQESRLEFLLDRQCEITGNMHDRHKVRWIKQLFLYKIFHVSKNLNDTAPYFVNIFMHSFLIVLSLFFINKTFAFSNKYNFFFLLYVTFIFQQYLGEYSYSIFEMFFLSMAIFSSKTKNIYLFFFSCLLAILNRESGFLILFTWFIFNAEFRIFLAMFILATLIFLIANFDLHECLVKTKFFIPLENQPGQINFKDILNNNLFSNIKLLFTNFIFPFGLFFYFFIKSIFKNKILLFIAIAYFFIFIFATPAHHMAVRLLLLPIILNAIYYKNFSKI